VVSGNLNVVRDRILGAEGKRREKVKHSSAMIPPKRNETKAGKCSMLFLVKI
jgi:hypothetical protein